MNLNYCMSRMRSIFKATLLSAAILSALPAAAEDIVIGNADSDDYLMKFSVKYTEATLIEVIPSREPKTTGLKIPATIDYNGRKYTVTTIKDMYGAEKLTTVTVPATVTELRGFDKCRSLETLTILPGGDVLKIGLVMTDKGPSVPPVRQFEYCPLKTVNIGRSIEYAHEPDYGDLYDPYEDSGKFANYMFNSLVNCNLTGENIKIALQIFSDIKNLTVGGSNVTLFVPGSSYSSLNAENLYLNSPVTLTGRYITTVKNLYLKDIQTLLSSSLSCALAVGAETNLYAGGELKEDIIIPEGVTSIPDYAFARLRLNRVTLSPTVRHIGREAFYLASLVSVDLAQVETIGEAAFSGCTRLATVKFGEGLKEIGDRAFSSCPFTTVSLPASLERIGENAFSSTSLTRIDFAAGSKLAEVGAEAFVLTPLTTVRFPDGLKVLGKEAFSKCTKLTFAYLGKSLQNIAQSTFEHCTALSEIEVPATVAEIGPKAFSGCTGLVLVTLNDGLEKIRTGAFAGTAMSSLTIPGTVTEIDDAAFDRTDKLNFLTLADGDKPIEIRYIYQYEYKELFSDSPLRLVYLGRDINKTREFGFFQDQQALKSLTIGPKVTALGDNMFKGCVALTKVAVPSNVRVLSDAVFSGCTALAGVTLTDGLETIGDYCFEKCPLPELTIPSTTTSVGSYAYKDCDKLTTITLADSGKPVTMGGGSSKNGCLFGDSPVARLHIGRDVLYQDDVASPFRNQEALAEVTFSDTQVTLLSKNLLRGCSAVNSLRLPSSLITIKHAALSEMSSLKALDIPGKTETIADSAFARNTSMAEVNMTNSVKAIGDFGFTDCTGMKQVRLSDNLTQLSAYLFYNCRSLLTVRIPDAVAEIGTHAFDCCSSIDNIVIPDKVKTLRPFVFSLCDALARLDLGKGLALIESNAINECHGLHDLTIPANVVTIKVGGLSGNQNLHNLTFADTEAYLEIENYATTGMFTGEGIVNLYLGRMLTYESAGFNSYPGRSPFMLSKTLKTMKFGPKVNSVQPCLFIDCSALEAAEVADGVINIGSKSFMRCTSLTDLKLGNTLVSIGENAFDGCTALERLVLPGSMREISDGAFEDSGLRDIDFAKIETIGPRAFSGCENLRAMSLPETLFGLGVEAFSWCGNLEYADIPAGPRNVGSKAFYNCKSLKWVSFGRTVTSIGNDAFAGCEAVEYVKSYNTTPPQGLTGFSPEVEKTATLYVPAASLEMYKLTPAWENFFKVSTLDDVVDVKSLSLDFAEYTLYDGQAVRLTVRTEPADALPSAYAWSSTDPEVASVDAAGIVTAGPKQGVATITVALAGDPAVSASCKVTHTSGQSLITELKLNYTAYAVAVGQSNYSLLVADYLPLNATDAVFTWSVSDGKILSITPQNDGKALKFMGLSSGEADVTVSNGRLSASCHVEVLSVVRQRPFAVYTGETFALPLPFDRTPSTPVEGIGWVSSDPSVLAVDADGNATALKNGKVTVTVKFAGDSRYYRDIYEITVKAVPAGCFVCDGSIYKNDDATGGAILVEALAGRDKPTDFTIAGELTHDGKTIPVTGVDAAAFAGFASLDRLVVPASVVTFPTEAVTKFTLKSVIFEDAAAAITLAGTGNIETEELYIGRPYAFDGTYTIAYMSETLRKAEIGGGATAVVSYSFYDCRQLASVTLGDKVETLAYRSFFGCAALTEISLPASLTSIGNEVFNGTDALTAIKCYAVTPPSLELYSLPAHFVSQTTLYVPEASLGLYKSHSQWSRFFRILPLESGVGDILTDDSKADVYTLGGVLLLENASREQYNELPAGYYIVNRRKILKR